jgi:DNA mismatch endonuclease, patch repair protein
MADVVSPETRSRMMAGIKGKDTKPEMIVRRGLHARGFRFRLHRRDLPGRPDLVLPMFRTACFVHGCFWHGHDCPAFKWPKSRVAFWRDKIEGNRERDLRALQALAERGWHVETVWECELKRSIDAVEKAIDVLAARIKARPVQPRSRVARKSRPTARTGSRGAMPKRSDPDAGADLRE